MPPDEDAPWHTWLLLGGRGAGKTRAGAAWVTGLVGGLRGIAAQRVGRIALIGETMADVRDVMIDGPSGLLAVAPAAERPQWKPSLRRLEWPSGAVAHAFSAEDPDSLRGPQFEAAWADELGKWRYAQETWDMLQFGLRLGDAAAPGRHDDAADDPADPAARRRARRRDDAGGDRRQCRQPRAGLFGAGHGGLRRHAARAPGARGRADRGPARRAVAARGDRGGARRGGAGAHRASRSRSIRRRRPAATPAPAASLRPGSMPAAWAMSSPTRPSRAWRRRPGRRRPSRSTGGFRPTRSSPRSTRAATWWRRCCASSTRPCR